MKQIKQLAAEFIAEKYAGKTSNQSNRARAREWQTLKEFAAFVKDKQTPEDSIAGAKR